MQSFLGNLSRVFRKAGTSRGGRFAPRRAPLQLEALENRLVPSTASPIGFQPTFLLAPHHAGAVTPASTTFTGNGFTPLDIRVAYNIDSRIATGAGQTIAIVDAFDDPNAESDLAVYRSNFGLPACTTKNGCFTKVSQTGSTKKFPRPDPGWAGEISLDLDMTSAICRPL